MNEAERIWSEKSDEDLLEAAASLAEYTEDGRRIIRAELKRRGLEDPVEQAATEAGPGVAEEEAEEPECLRCHVKLLLIDPDDARAVARWGWVGELSVRLPGRDGLDIYICPRCGHVDLFAEPPEESEPEQEATDEDEAPRSGPSGWGQG